MNFLVIQRLYKTSKNEQKSSFLTCLIKEDDFIVETDASNEHWSAVFKIKEEKNSARL